MRIFSPHYNFMSFLKMPNQVIVKQYFQCNLKIDILFDQFNKILYSIWRFIFYHIFISIVRYLNVWIIFLMCHQSTKYDIPFSIIFNVSSRNVFLCQFLHQLPIAKMPLFQTHKNTFCFSCMVIYLWMKT